MPPDGFKPPDVDVRRLENLEPVAIETHVKIETHKEGGNPRVFFTRKPLSPSLINDGIGFGERIVDRFLVPTSEVPLTCTFLMTTSGKVTLTTLAPKKGENP